MEELHNWSVYMIRCTNGALYTGITTDMSRRWQQHSRGEGARFFNRGRAPVEIVFLEPGHTKSSAAKREAVIKQLTRARKLALLEQQGMGEVCWVSDSSLPDKKN